MRRWVVVCLLGVMGLGAAGAYLASPLVAAWRIQNAIRTADTVTVKRKIEWESFRASLKQTIMRNAQLMPETARAARRIRPTLWQRVKRAFGGSMIDRFIETNVTPEGLSRLYQAHAAKRRARSNAAFDQRLRQRSRPTRTRANRSRIASWRAKARAGVKLRRAPAKPTRRPRIQRASTAQLPTRTIGSWRERLSSFTRRLERAEFADLTTFFLRIRDKYDPRRSYVGRLELIGIEWKLTHVRIITERATKQRQTRPGLMARATR